MERPDRLISARIFTFFATGTAFLGCCASSTAIADPPTPIDKDATLIVRELTIPPSDYWSPEFKSLYAQLVVQSRAAPAQRPDFRPARDAPKAAWDKLYAAEDHMLADLVAMDLSRYPVIVTDTTIAGVHVGVISPKDGIPPENRSRILINLHGGGFVDFKGLSYGELESIPVTSIGKIKTITVDYRQAPYYHYPAASEDVAAVYRALLKHYRPSAIGIFGCSAGGELTAQSVAWFQTKRLPRPGAVGILCAAPPTGQPPESRPPTRDTWRGGWVHAGDSAIWRLGVIPEVPSERAPPQLNDATEWYMEGVDTQDLNAFPGASDTVLAKFPPTLLLSGTRTVECSPAVVAHARFLKLGVDSSLYLIEGGWHAVHVTAIGTTEARDANTYIARWFLQHLAR